MHKQVLRLLMVHDCEVLVAALEMIYQLTSWPEVAAKFAQLPGAMSTIVSFLNFAPDRWPDRCTHLAVSLFFSCRSCSFSA